MTGKRSVRLTAVVVSSQDIQAVDRTVTDWIQDTDPRSRGDAARRVGDIDDEIDRVFIR